MHVYAKVIFFGKKKDADPIKWPFLHTLLGLHRVILAFLLYFLCLISVEHSELDTDITLKVAGASYYNMLFTHCPLLSHWQLISTYTSSM